MVSCRDIPDVARGAEYARGRCTGTAGGGLDGGRILCNDSVEAEDAEGDEAQGRCCLATGDAEEAGRVDSAEGNGDDIDADIAADCTAAIAIAIAVGKRIAIVGIDLAGRVIAIACCIAIAIAVGKRIAIVGIDFAGRVIAIAYCIAIAVGKRIAIVGIDLAGRVIAIASCIAIDAGGRVGIARRSGTSTNNNGHTTCSGAGPDNGTTCTGATTCSGTCRRNGRSDTRTCRRNGRSDTCTCRRNGRSDTCTRRRNGRGNAEPNIGIIEANGSASTTTFVEANRTTTASTAAIVGGAGLGIRRGGATARAADTAGRSTTTEHARIWIDGASGQRCLDRGEHVRPSRGHTTASRRVVVPDEYGDAVGRRCLECGRGRARATATTDRVDRCGWGCGRRRGRRDRRVAWWRW